MTKVALITGITGQDGTYISKLLLDKGYVVHGIKRESSTRAEEKDKQQKNANLHFHFCDMTDYSKLLRIIKDVCPDEIYNLAAQSNVQVSFDRPEYTAEINALGTFVSLKPYALLGWKRKQDFSGFHRRFVRKLTGYPAK
ncbi:GDP-mannose 4,6-dehydratase [Methanosarcina horonobensis]|uniref:GDP-mannose 4,6-dehydratase n=1 Tax=Methanosarcina horonobensis TaxID=418008 RepID=UPI000B26C902